jgi:hypothetical protein
MNRNIFHHLHCCFASLADTVYHWIGTWFHSIETVAEFNLSYSMLSSWVDSQLDPLTALYSAIQKFLFATLLPHCKKFLRCYRLSRRGFDENSNSVCESQNSSVKRGVMRIMPNMSLSSSAQVLADKQSMLQKNRDVHNATHLNATSLWSASLTSIELTKYAEGLVAQNFDRRLCYSTVQGMYSCNLYIIALP